MTEQEIYNLIKHGYDPIPSMYPRTMLWSIARKNGKSRTDLKNLFDFYFNYDDSDVINRRLLYKTIIKNKKVKESMRNIPFIKNVIFNEPATIVFWTDDTKTVVKCQNETYDPEKGLAMAIAKKALGNEHDYYGKNFGKWISEAAVKVEEKPQEELKPESSTLKIGDKAVVIGNGRTGHNYKNGDIVRIVAKGIASDSMFVAIESRTVKNHPTQHIEKVNLKKLAKDQTLRPGDKLVVIKDPSYGCRYEIGEIVTLMRVVEPSVTGGNIIHCKNCRGVEQRLKDLEVVKIVDGTPKAEPEKPKRMTFREEVAIKEPHRIQKEFIGGVAGCPRDNNYKGPACFRNNCKGTSECIAACTKCWDREIPEEKLVEDSVLRSGDKAVKVHGESDDIDHHPFGAVLDVESANDKCEHVSTLGPTNRYPNDKISQNTYRTCLKKLAKDQTLKKGDKLVVIKKPSYDCDFVPGEIVTITYIADTRRILATRNPKSQMNQILKASEVVKIVE